MPNFGGVLQAVNTFNESFYNFMLVSIVSLVDLKAVKYRHTFCP